MALVGGRTKQVTDPFNENLRARICNLFGSESSYISSGSEHDGDTEFTSSSFSSSPRLSNLVQNFLENDSNTTAAPPPTDSTQTYPTDSDEEEEEERKPSTSNPNALIRDVIYPLLRYNNADRFKTDLLINVTKAAEIFSLFQKSKSVYNRNIMAYLRELGYNAGLCKTKWEATPGGGLTAGNHEFLDVIKPERSTPSSSSSSSSSSFGYNGGGVRYFIDTDFSDQFMIARETENYRTIISALPRIFIGKSEVLKRLIRLMSDEARRSIRCSGLTMPPWRKNRYMQAKWFGPYRRTLNQVPTVMNSDSSSNKLSGVKCRFVGFDAAQGSGGCSGTAGRLFAAPPATKTR